MIKAHPSLFLLSFVIIGIVLGDTVGLSPLLGLVAATFAAGLAILLFLRQRHSWAALLVGCALGLVTAVNFGLQLRGIGPNHLAGILTEPTLCRVCGRVSDWPDLKQGRTEIEIAIDSLARADEPGATVHDVRGRLLLKVSDTTTALQRGDRVAFQARVYPVRRDDRESYGYGRYLNLRGIFAQAFLPTVLTIHVDRRPSVGFWPMVDWVRSAVCGSLERNLSPTASALARGFLIGETRDIPSDVYGRFRDTGTLHVLAVSGANVALVLMFFLWTMRPFWLGPRTRMLILLGVILIFSGVSYGDPSVVRASVMAALVLGARLLGRVYDLNNIIAATALIILLIRSTELFDVGFQLSFVTAWGLIFIVPKIGEAFGALQERRWYRWVLMPVFVSIVAQIVSSPLILLYFERLPVISLAANLVVVPLVSIGVIGVLILLMADFIWPMLGLMVGSLVDLWLRGLLRVLEFFGGGDAPVWKSNLLASSSWGPAVVVMIFLILVLATLALSHKYARRALVVLILIVVNVALVVGLSAFWTEPQTVWRADRIPGGVALLISSPESSRAELVITGLSRTSGSSGGTVVEALLRRHGIDHLGRLIVLGGDYDALADILRLARKYEADSLLLRRITEPSICDLQAREDSSFFRGEVLYYGGLAGRSADLGCFLSDDRVTYRFGRSQVDVVDREPALATVAPTPGLTNVLIIGGRWQPEASDWIDFHRAGYERIICAKSEQRSTPFWPDAELERDALPPDYVVDLSKTGEIRLNPDR